MKRYVLDTSALLTLRSDEPGAARVAELMQEAAMGKISCHGCFLSLMEVLYRVWKNEGQAAGLAAYRHCQDLPMQWVHESTALLERAARVKATHPLSLADAWIAATALELDATLVHKDPEFEKLPGLLEERLPYKCASADN
jgi:predicted nucleic acid-binding protein